MQKYDKVIKGIVGCHEFRKQHIELKMSGTQRDGHGKLSVNYIMTTVEDGRKNVYDVWCNISGLIISACALYVYSATLADHCESNDYTLTNVAAEALAQKVIDGH